MDRLHKILPSGFFKKHRAPLLALLGILSGGILVAAALAVIPAAAPATGAELADVLRSVVGVQAVTELESLSDRLRDEIDRVRFSGAQTAPQISLVSGGFPTLPPPSEHVPNPAGQAAPRPGNVALAPAADVVTADPQLNWQPYGPNQGGTPLMARTLILVDPQRSYAGVALVRIDTSRLQLRMMPGYIEPAHPSGIGKKIVDLGRVPLVDRRTLVAAFNGGFKQIHGHYGMMVDGLTLLPPVDGLATVAIYRDGTVRMGAWGRDLLPSPDMVAFRQNCPPLLDAGQLNPGLSTNADRAWGFTRNDDITWRTGLGLSQDGKYLIYAVGNGTNALFLAEALQKAGAYWAMQLDINQYYAEFLTYSRSDGNLSGQRLLDKMNDQPQMFLQPDIRDFFYLTLR